MFNVVAGTQSRGNPFFGRTGILPVTKRQARCLSYQDSRTRLHAKRGIAYSAGRDAGTTAGSESGVTNDPQDAGPTHEIASSLYSSQ